MSRKILIDAFFGQFASFIDELVKVFPTDTDFPTYKMALMVLHKTNPMIVIEQIVIHVLPFEETIKARDEKFFLSHGFSDYMGDDTLGNVIMKMKDRWGSLTANNKKCVWDFITLLLELTKRVTAK
jgi:hypothetical protein